jgi:hypothetical protein
MFAPFSSELDSFILRNNNIFSVTQLICFLHFFLTNIIFGPEKGKRSSILKETIAEKIWRNPS